MVGGKQHRITACETIATNFLGFAGKEEFINNFAKGWQR